MIIGLTKENLSAIDNSFLSKQEVLNNLNNNPFGKYLILIEQNEVIGYLYYSDIYERAEINQIEIEKQHRNQKKATLLLKTFLEKINKSVTLEVKIDNIPALKLYKKFGFEKKALRKGYYNGIDGILMERKIWLMLLYIVAFLYDKNYLRFNKKKIKNHLKQE